MGVIGDGYTFVATAREVARRSQTQMMGSASILGWLVTAMLVALGAAARATGLFLIGVGLVAVMTWWEIRNHRRRHRWDRLEERAAAQRNEPPA